jgi:alpha-galactosidase
MFHPRSRRVLLHACLLALAFGSSRPLADDVPSVASYDDAYVRHDTGGASWAIGNSGIEYVVGFDASGTLSALQLWNPSTGESLDIDQAPDAAVTISGDRVLLNQLSDKLAYMGASAETTDSGVRLVFTFEHRTLHTIVRRTYACYPGSPTIETWTRIESPPRSPPVQVSNMNGWSLTMPVGTVKWITGLRGESASQAPSSDTFAVSGGELEEGETDIGSIARASDTFVPIIFNESADHAFYGGVIWSGSWRIAMVRKGDRVTISSLFPGISTSLTPDKPVEFPHTFFGVAGASGSAEAAALRPFVLRGIRRGRPIQPLVTYNTWFPYGAWITEADVDDEMHRASDMGVELFVLDAGWWIGAGANGQGDFSSGLGSWTPDPDRFPAQLTGLADEAHALGMKFGLWVEPERIALSTLGRAGMASEQWLATQSGSYNSDGTTAQVCLAAPAARKWLLSKLVNLIETAHPDYLKWDNNFWINCDRAGHGHGQTDGNYGHVLGLYTLLDQIRQLYPDLLIENVSGGGNRLDYGMLAYTDAGWMDDLTAPSDHVRHNVEGLSLAFPPSYLLSFVIDSAQESLYDPDLPLVVRSRMPGALGLTYRSSELDEDLRARLTAEVARYKLLRDTIAQSSAALLTAQAPVQQDGWDIVQELADDRRNLIIFAYKNDSDDGATIVRPQGLDPATIYSVQSIDHGELGSATGADLMVDGVELVHSPAGSRAHLIVISAQ